MSPLIRDLVHEVATHFALEHLGEDLATTKDRHKNIADARAVAMWVARKRTSMSFPEIGREFDKDHTTVMSAVRKIDKAIAVEPSGRLASIARAVIVSFKVEAFELGRIAACGARTVSLPKGADEHFELDTGPAYIGAAE